MLELQLILRLKLFLRLILELWLIISNDYQPPINCQIGGLLTIFLDLAMTETKIWARMWDIKIWARMSDIEDELGIQSNAVASSVSLSL